MTDYFDRLENELRSAVVRQEAGSAGRSSAGQTRRRLARMSRPMLALTAALLIAVPAAAAVVVFAPQREPDGLLRTAPKTPIASGEDPEFGRWQAFVSDSTSGPCLGIRLIDPPGVLPGSTSEGCGITEAPARIGGGDGPPRTALFGFAPKTSKRVRILADGQPGREFPTHQTTDPRGDLFFASLPENPGKLPGLRVVALDGDGRPVATIEGP